jgi:BirA family biotin operon repressor/biotin-[acetyl-CoA-carboxylase] ligase
MTSPWTDLDRPPLREAELRRALLVPGGLWTGLRVLAETGSTNTDLVQEAFAGAPEGRVLVAELQSGGRGRLDRRWTAPARSGIFCSVLLRPAQGDQPVAQERWSWLPLLAGVAAASALRLQSGTDVRLKWPNDLLAEVGGAERKIGGILAEALEGGVVVGLGINVSLRAEELPVPTAGSLALAGAETTDRETLLRALLRTFAELYGEWRAAGGDPEASGLRPAYAASCATLGRTVRAELPGDRVLEGEAEAVDGEGRLVVRGADGTRTAVAAGDVVHVRPA